MIRSTGFIPKNLVYLLVLAGTVHFSGSVRTVKEFETLIKQNIDQTYASIYENPGDRFRDDYADLIAQDAANNKPITAIFSLVDNNMYIITDVSEEDLKATIKNHDNDIISNLEKDRVVGIGVACRIVDSDNKSSPGIITCYIVFTSARKDLEFGGSLKAGLATVPGFEKAIQLDLDTAIGVARWKAAITGSRLGNSKTPKLGNKPLIVNEVTIQDVDDLLIGVLKTNNPGQDIKLILQAVADFLNKGEEKNHAKHYSNLISIEAYSAPARFNREDLDVDTDSVYLTAVFTFVITDVDPAFEKKMFDALEIQSIRKSGLDNPDNKANKELGDSIAIQMADKRAIELSREELNTRTSFNEAADENNVDSKDTTVPSCTDGCTDTHNVAPAVPLLKGVEIVYRARTFVLTNCPPCEASTDVTNIVQKITEDKEWAEVKKLGVYACALAQSINKLHLIFVVLVLEHIKGLERVGMNAQAMLNVWKLAKTGLAPKTIGGESVRLIKVSRTDYLTRTTDFLPVAISVDGVGEAMKITSIMLNHDEAQQNINQRVYRRLTVDEKAKAVASRSKTVLSKQDDKEKGAGISTVEPPAVACSTETLTTPEATSEAIPVSKPSLSISDDNSIVSLPEIQAASSDKTVVYEKFAGRDTPKSEEGKFADQEVKVNEKEIGVGSVPNGTSASLASCQDKEGLASSEEPTPDSKIQYNNVGTTTTTQSRRLGPCTCCKNRINEDKNKNVVAVLKRGPKT